MVILRIVLCMVVFAGYTRRTLIAFEIHSCPFVTAPPSATTFLSISYNFCTPPLDQGSILSFCGHSRSIKFRGYTWNWQNVTSELA